MNTLNKIIFLFTLLFALSSCDTPKSLTKKGDKFVEKNLYKDATIQYMKALNKKSDFIAAKEGLRESGQKQVNIYLDDFFKSKNFGEKRAAIYHYRNANELKNKISAYSINIDIPTTYTNDYNSIWNYSVVSQVFKQFRYQINKSGTIYGKFKSIFTGI